MSEWKSVLKSTSIEKQTSDEAMDKLLEGLGKVIADYSKEKATNQPTTATQPTQPTRQRLLPTQAPTTTSQPATTYQLQEQLEQERQQRAKQQMETGYRGAPDKRVTSDKPFAASTPKPATGFKALSQKEVDAMKGFGYTDKHIKELDKQRLKQYGEAPPSLGQRAVDTGKQVTQQVRQKVQQLPQWMKNLKNKPTGKPEAQDVRVGEGGTVTSSAYTRQVPTGQQMRRGTKGTGFFGKEPASTQRRGGTRINPKAGAEAEKKRQEQWPLTGIRGQGKK